LGGSLEGLGQSRPVSGAPSQGVVAAERAFRMLFCKLSQANRGEGGAEYPRATGQVLSNSTGPLLSVECQALGAVPVLWLLVLGTYREVSRIRIHTSAHPFGPYSTVPLKHSLLNLFHTICPSAHGLCGHL